MARRLELEARRQQLIELGLKVFAERAYDEIAIDDLARAAKISKGLLYHYFPTKKDFYVATLREASRRMLATVANPGGSLAPMERLSQGLDAYLQYVAQHGKAYSALLRSGVGTDPEAARIVDGTREEFLRRLLQGMGLSRPQVMVRTALRGWIGFVEAATLDWVERGARDRPVLRKLLTDLLVYSVNKVINA